MDLGLKNKRVLITGASRGIGRAILDIMLAEGALVAFCARSADQVQDINQRMDAAGLPCHGMALDVRDTEHLVAWQQGAVERMGGADIYIPNVSAGAGQGLDAWRANFETDLMATVTGCDHILPYLAQSGAGSIVVITTIAALEAMGEPGPYNSIKAALLTYASQLGDAAGPHKIRVNAVSPGPIHVADGFWGQVQQAQPDVYQDICTRHHLGRLGTPEEVARAVAFLASPVASWVTRTNMVIDGGYSRRIQF